MNFFKSKTKKREREANRIGRSGELLGEKDQSDRTEQVERPTDRAADEDGGQDPLG
jgi:hypothetical protein